MSDTTNQETRNLKTARNWLKNAKTVVVSHSKFGYVQLTKLVAKSLMSDADSEQALLVRYYPICDRMYIYWEKEIAG